MKSAFDSLLVIVFPSVPLSRVKERSGKAEGGSKLTTEVEMRCNSVTRSGVSFKHLQRRRVVDPERRISNVVAFNFISATKAMLFSWFWFCIKQEQTKRPVKDHKPPAGLFANKDEDIRGHFGAVLFPKQWPNGRESLARLWLHLVFCSPCSPSFTLLWKKTAVIRCSANNAAGQRYKISVQREQTDASVEGLLSDPPAECRPAEGNLLEDKQTLYLCFGPHRGEAMVWSTPMKYDGREEVAWAKFLLSYGHFQPSRASVLKVTELSLNTDNINGTADISISSSVFLPAESPSCLWGFWSVAEQRTCSIRCLLRSGGMCKRHKWNCLKLI